jgi:hypothetical protein
MQSLSVRLLSNHYLSRGDFYRLAIKTQAKPATKEEQCISFLTKLETQEQIPFDCEEIYVVEQRSECDLHYQLPSGSNLVHLLEDEDLGIGTPSVFLYQLYFTYTFKMKMKKNGASVNSLDLNDDESSDRFRCESVSSLPVALSCVEASTMTGVEFKSLEEIFHLVKSRIA